MDALGHSGRTFLLVSAVLVSSAINLSLARDGWGARSQREQSESCRSYDASHACGPRGGEAGEIVVRAERQVSSAHPGWPHDEVMVSVSPNDFRRMLACSVVLIPEMAKRTTAIYQSSDGGLSWQPSRTITHFKESSDPVCYFGPDGTAYFSVEGGDRFLPEVIELYRSLDGGDTWADPTELEIAAQGLDRQFLVADDTAGPHRGRLFLNADMFVRSVDKNGFDDVLWGIALRYSDDQGVTWSAPAERVGRPERVIWKSGNCDILASGQVLCAFAEQLPPRASKPESMELVRVTRSSDFGSTLDLPRTVASTEKSPELSFYLPRVAIDRWSVAFQNRAYLVWSETHRGIARITCAHSDDAGETWSTPTLVSDSSYPEIDFLPQISINAHGVVGIMWYRRTTGTDVNYGVRFSASLDGGTTFLPSVQISGNKSSDRRENWPVTAVTSGRFGDLFGDIGGGAERSWTGPLELTLQRYVKHLTGGETAGLAADATGVFHLLWVDRRTGVDQVWTAAVEVKGSPSNLSDPKASSRDVTGDVSISVLKIANVDNEEFVATVTLTNKSQSKLVGPLELRVTSIASDVGQVDIRNADNHTQKAGAIWRIEATNGGLGPGQASHPLALHFHVAKPLPWRDAKGLHLSLADIQLQVLAKGSTSENNDARRDQGPMRGNAAHHPNPQFDGGAHEPE